MRMVKRILKKLSKEMLGKISEKILYNNILGIIISGDISEKILEDIFKK